MLKGAIASIIIAIALFLIYDMSTSYQAACVMVPAPARMAAAAPPPPPPAPVVVLVPTPAPTPAPFPVPAQPNAPADGQIAPPVATPPVANPPAINPQVLSPQILNPQGSAQPAARAPVTMELCGFDRSMTMRTTRAVFDFLDERQGTMLTAAALVLIVIGVFIALFTAEIAAAARRTANHARRSAEHLPRLERGYVFVSQVDKSTWVSADNERIMVAMDVRNYGRTPTILIETYGEFLSAPPEVRPAKYPFADANKQVHQTVLAPGAPALRLDDRFFGKFVEPAYFLGYVKYRDVFRATHVSCWCLKSKRVGEGWVWEPAGVAGWDDYD